MSFKNLEERYNATVDSLYSAAQNKYQGGTKSTGLGDDPIITRRVGDGYWGFGENRSTPVRSAITDVERLSLFSIKPQGLLFLAKQQLLQTGNTFKFTRLLNPTFAIGNAVPFLHVRRQLRPINGQLFGVGQTDTSYSNLRKIGQLQTETYDDFKTLPTLGGLIKKVLPSPLVNTVSAFTAKRNVGDKYGYEEAGWKKSRPELGDNELFLPYFISNYTMGSKAPPYIFGTLDLLSRIKVQSITGQNNKFKYGGAVVPDNGTFSGIRYGPISDGGVGRLWDRNYKTYLKTNSFGFGGDYTSPTTYTLHPNYVKIDAGTRTSLLSDSVVSAIKNWNEPEIQTKIRKQQSMFTSSVDTLFNEETGGSITSQPFLKYFSSPDSSNGVIISRDSLGENGNAKNLSINASGSRKRLRYMRDPLNESFEGQNVLERYDNLRTIDDNSNLAEDAIVVSFAMGRNSPVQFRAFIRDLTENASPEYKPYQYIGRIEKFVYYVTVQRDISFTLDVLAFSKDELEIVWNRINYLTGLVFPYDVKDGILQPNITRLTIGNVYTDQPGYITRLDKSFNEISESWDIDNQVPIAATMKMSFTLIEKQSRTANSPFHGINERPRPRVTIGEIDTVQSNTPNIPPQ